MRISQVWTNIAPLILLILFPCVCVYFVAELEIFFQNPEESWAVKEYIPSPLMRVIGKAFVNEYYLIVISATIQSFHLGGIEGKSVLYDADDISFYLGAK